MKKIEVGEYKKKDITIYIILRILVIINLIIQLFRGNFENVFMCILTLILFLIPVFIDRKLNIKLPDTLEKIILLFIFSAEILGEVQNFYGIFKNWDTILHTINGFLCAAIGFSMIDILNRSEKFHTKMKPIFVGVVAFCFSMTIGVLWEFFEYGMDNIFKTDMQKDRIVQSISSVEINPEKENNPIVVDNINKTVIYYVQKDGTSKELTIDGGYLDIGIKDTMKDLIVNFIGAMVYSFIGYFYIKGRDEYKFAENFIPKRKTKKEIEETRLADMLFKQNRKKKKEKE
ncbi:MAG: hypothetical protein J6K42_03095 [Clostridia bacterium]|nr:hypothetical protein [Clostridia bacterium]